MPPSPLRTLVLTGALLLPGSVVAQTLPSGPQVLTFHSDVDDTEQPYGLYLPPDFDANRRYPLVVMLHGAGSNHRLSLRRVFGHSNAEGETDVEASRDFPEWEPRDYIVATPFARGTMGYQGIAEKDVLDVLADVKRRFPIDENRVYLTGLSMGGGGTLWLGLTRPDLWAAIAPVCPAPPGGTEAFAGNALNLPVKIFQGGADPVVRPEGTRAWVEGLRTSGTSVEYEEYPGVQHDSWVQAYAGGRIFDWFDQHVRDAFPARVRFAADSYQHGSAYWVTFDALTPGTPATIDASFTGPNRVTASTGGGLDGFTLELEGHANFRADSRFEVVIDGQRLRVDEPGDVLSFHREGKRWRAGRATSGKRAGAEGPMAQVVADRHIYVYGTAGNPSEEELASRRAQAERAASWSVYRGEFLGRVMVFPRVLADRELRPSDFAESNLVLFGTRETNQVIERFADRLPIHLPASQVATHGLAYVYPIDGRYVLVSSGRPWWDAPSASGGAGAARFAGMDAMRLTEFQDYLLFSDAGILASGRFDREWRLATPILP